MKENSDKYTKFSYNYEKHTVIVRSGKIRWIEFNIYDFKRGQA
jgi:hypothetical protein